MFSYKEGKPCKTCHLWIVMLLAVSFFLRLVYWNMAEYKTATPVEPKLVLFWTETFHRRFPWGAEGDATDLFRDCPVPDCVYVDERQQLNRSDAVVFHARNLAEDDVPPWRLAHQRWIFFNLEAPPNSGRYGFMKDAFNWTMTYR